MNQESIFGKDEKKLIDFFVRLKDNYKTASFVFLSRRFFNLYSILVKKYPEIELSSCCIIYDKSTKVNGSVVYLNDINYELPKKMGLKDKIITYSIIYNCDLNRIDYGIPNITMEDKKKSCDHSLFVPTKFRKKFVEFNYKSLNEIIDFMAKEIYLLEDITLAPDFIQNYFKFYSDNQEQIEFLLKDIYEKDLIYDAQTDEEIEGLITDITNKLVEKFGKENLSDDFMLWLSNSLIINPSISFHNMFHHSVRKNKINYQKYYNLSVNNRIFGLTYEEFCLKMSEYENVTKTWVDPALEQFSSKVKKIGTINNN